MQAGTGPLLDASSTAYLAASQSQLPTSPFAHEGISQSMMGGADTLLIGGGGADLIIGSAGRNLLIGGFGSDRAMGSRSDEFFLAGSHPNERHNAALQAVLNEWTSADRLAFLVQRKQKDAAADHLIDSREAGADWYFRSAGDNLTDLYGDEMMTGNRM